MKGATPPVAPGECQAVQYAQCGAAACQSILWKDPGPEAFGLPDERGLSPCCPWSAPDTCGHDLSPIYVWLWGAGDACLAVDQPGVPDPECPSVVAGEEHPDILDFQGCRRPDGSCGFSSAGLSAAGIACVEATFVLCSAGAPCEPACDQRCLGTCAEVVPDPVDGVQPEPYHVCKVP